MASTGMYLELQNLTVQKIENRKVILNVTLILILNVLRLWLSTVCNSVYVIIGTRLYPYIQVVKGLWLLGAANH